MARKQARRVLTILLLAAFTVFVVEISFVTRTLQNVGTDETDRIKNSMEMKLEQIQLSTQKMTVVLTYMRSGSSLTGDIIQQDPGTFYVFEPMHFMDIASLENKAVVMFNGEERFFKPEQLLNVANPIMESFFQCKFENIFCSILRDGLFMSKSIKIWDYRQCVVNIRPADKNCGTVLERCIPILREKCKESNNILIKTIRLPMEFMSSFMKKHLNLKIILLVRDPRATLRSEIATGYGTWNNIYNISKAFCERVIKDLEISRQIEDQYPGRVQRIRYEDIVSDPIDMSKKMYDFLGLEFTDTIRKYIMSKTYGGQDPEVKMEHWKVNATETMLHWRLITPIKHVQTIDAHCQTLYNHVGYLPALSEQELKDLSKPLTVAFE